MAKPHAVKEQPAFRSPAIKHEIPGAADEVDAAVAELETVITTIEVRCSAIVQHGVVDSEFSGERPTSSVPIADWMLGTVARLQELTARLNYLNSIIEL